MKVVVASMYAEIMAALEKAVVYYKSGKLCT